MLIFTFLNDSITDGEFTLSGLINLAGWGLIVTAAAIPNRRVAAPATIEERAPATLPSAPPPQG